MEGPQIERVRQQQAAGRRIREQSLSRSQLYEARIEKLHEEYGRKGVAFVAINPNNPKAVRLDELGYTDVTDSLPR